MPDELLLALWLEDELAGPELERVEAWAASQPEQVAAREELRRWKTQIAAVIPAAEEPPYAEFFNSRITRVIRELEPVAAVPAPRKQAFWRAWLMPITACAGMALAFLIGKQSSPDAPVVVETPPRVIYEIPVVYTPDRSVSAEWFDSDPAAATVIVLQGIEAIPDTMDFLETAAISAEDEKTATASRVLREVVQ